jgi:malonyl-CoA/methylmalonyl-CoA synthetase
VLLTELFDISLAGRADAPALDIDAGGGIRTLTFGDLGWRSWRTMALLRERGVRPGDRVAVHLANRLEFIDLFLACLRLGAIFVPMNILYRGREIGHLLQDADPALIVAARATIDRFPPGAPIVEVDELFGTIDRDMRRQSREEPWPLEATSGVAVSDDDGDAAAAIVYTSGTTGRSKGAVLTHNNFLANAVAIMAAWRITESDRYLAVLPLFHVHGLGNGLCAWLASGCRMRLVERFEHPRAAELFDAFQPTLFFGVPTIYAHLMTWPADLARRIGGRVRLFVSGSAPLPPAVFEGFREKFGQPILERYGMSETLMLISNPYVGERRAGTVGSPLPGVSVRLVSADGGPVPGGSPGAMQVRGSSVFRSYWRDPAATAASFDGDWFRTSDIARRSADGYYTLCGRASDLIISAGFNIYPREIEELLLELPSVSEAAVAGAPDARRGEVPVAYVVAADGFDPQQASALCRRELASFKVPRAFIRLDRLPRNALGKVQKHLLPPVALP